MGRACSKNVRSNAYRNGKFIRKQTTRKIKTQMGGCYFNGSWRGRMDWYVLYSSGSE
jgi:hypothetical protein